jgi:hypothetical protein
MAWNSKLIRTRPVPRRQNPSGAALLHIVARIAGDCLGDLKLEGMDIAQQWTWSAGHPGRLAWAVAREFEIIAGNLPSGHALLTIVHGVAGGCLGNLKLEGNWIDRKDRVSSLRAPGSDR